MQRVLLILMLVALAVVTVWNLLDRGGADQPVPPEQGTSNAWPPSALPDGPPPAATRRSGASPPGTAKREPVVDTVITVRKSKLITLTSTGPSVWRIRGVCRTASENESEAGRPVPHARVSIWRWGHRTRRIAEVVADARGRFEARVDSLKDLSPAVRHHPHLYIRAHARGWITTDQIEVPGPLPVEDNRPYAPSVVVSLEARPSISGRVIDAAGKPLSGVSVQIADHPEEPDEQREASVEVETFEGRFTKACWDVGRLWVYIHADGMKSAPPRSR